MEKKYHKYLINWKETWKQVWLINNHYICGETFKHFLFLLFASQKAPNYGNYNIFCDFFCPFVPLSVCLSVCLLVWNYNIFFFTWFNFLLLCLGLLSFDLFSIWLSYCLSAGPFVCLSVCMFFCLLIYCLFFCLFVCPPTCLFVCFSVCLLPICLLSICLLVCLNFYLSVFMLAFVLS